MSKIAKLQSQAFRKLTPEQKEQIRRFNPDVYNEMVRTNKGEADYKVYDLFRRSAMMCKDPSKYLSKPQLIECLFRKYKTFGRQMLEYKAEIEHAKRMKEQGRAVFSSPIMTGMQYQKFLNIFFKIMMNGGEGPTIRLENGETIGGVTPAVSKRMWERSYGFGSGRDEIFRKYRIDINDPEWYFVPGVSEPDPTVVGANRVGWDGEIFKYPQQPKFTLKQYEDIIKILLPYFQILNPGNEALGAWRLRGNNGYSFYIADIRLTNDKIGAEKLFNFINSQITWMNKNNLTEQNAQRGLRIPAKYLREWDRSLRYSDDNIPDEDGNIVGPTKIHASQKTFSYEQMMKMFNVLTKEQLIYMIIR